MLLTPREAWAGRRRPRPVDDGSGRGWSLARWRMLGAARHHPFDAGILRRGRDLRAVGGGADPGRTGTRCATACGSPHASGCGLTPEHRHAALVHASALCLGRDAARLRPDVSRRGVGTAARGAVAGCRARPRRRRSARGRGVLAGPPARRATGGRGPSSAGSGVTPVARTVVDLARTGTLHTAVAAADHALRHGSVHRRGADGARWMPCHAGCVAGKRARLVGELADPLSMSAGESLSQGADVPAEPPRPELQKEVHDADGLVGSRGLRLATVSSASSTAG